MESRFWVLRERETSKEGEEMATTLKAQFWKSHFIGVIDSDMGKLHDDVMWFKWLIVKINRIWCAWKCSGHAHQILSECYNSLVFFGLAKSDANRSWKICGCHSSLRWSLTFLRGCCLRRLQMVSGVDGSPLHTKDFFWIVDVVKIIVTYW